VTSRPNTAGSSGRKAGFGRRPRRRRRACRHASQRVTRVGGSCASHPVARAVAPRPQPLPGAVAVAVAVARRHDEVGAHEVVAAVVRRAPVGVRARELVERRLRAVDAAAVAVERRVDVAPDREAPCRVVRERGHALDDVPVPREREGRERLGVVPEERLPVQHDRQEGDGEGRRHARDPARVGHGSRGPSRRGGDGGAVPRERSRPRVPRDARPVAARRGGAGVSPRRPPSGRCRCRAPRRRRRCGARSPGPREW